MKKQKFRLSFVNLEKLMLNNIIICFNIQKPIT